MTRPGLFIVLEGIEGSGKSTQAALLARALEAAGHDCLHTREPGGTPLGEEIRKLLLHGGAMPAMAELLLMLAARATLVSERIRPALAAGRTVIADRYSMSTLAYQGYGRELDLQRVREVVSFATGGVAPDLTILIEVPREEGERRKARRGADDRIEGAGAAFHARVAEAYRLLAESEPGVVRVAGTGTEPEVARRIRTVLAQRFPETFSADPGFIEQAGSTSGEDA